MDRLGLVISSQSFGNDVIAVALRQYRFQGSAVNADRGFAVIAGGAASPTARVRERCGALAVGGRTASDAAISQISASRGGARPVFQDGDGRWLEPGAQQGERGPQAAGRWQGSDRGAAKGKECRPCQAQLR